jgi:hypothetical protein
VIFTYRCPFERQYELERNIQAPRSHAFPESAFKVLNGSARGNFPKEIFANDVALLSARQARFVSVVFLHPSISAQLNHAVWKLVQFGCGKSLNDMKFPAVEHAPRTSLLRRVQSALAIVCLAPKQN